MIEQPESLLIFLAVAGLLFVLHRLRGSQAGPAPLPGEGDGGGDIGMVSDSGCDASAGV